MKSQTITVIQRTSKGIRAVVIPLTIAVGWMSSGCSLVVVDGPRQAGKNCSTSYLAPIVDTGLTALTARAAYLIYTSSSYQGSTLKTLNAIWLVTEATSAVVGYVRVADCREELTVGPNAPLKEPPSSSGIWKITPPSSPPQ